MSTGGALKQSRKNEPERVRSSILDAAEHLFAKHGFHGVGVREIAAEAGCNLGRLTYYFGTKEDLFRSVVARRAQEYVHAIDNSLAEAVISLEENRAPAETIIRAHITPIFRLSQTSEGWKNYIQLLVRAANERQHEVFLQPMIEYYEPLMQRIISSFRKIDENVDLAKIHWGFYFIEAALLHILLEAGTVDRHSNGLCRAADLDSILNEAVPFFAAGFERLSRTVSGAPTLAPSKISET